MATFRVRNSLFSERCSFPSAENTRLGLVKTSSQLIILNKFTLRKIISNV